jgi:hypothetical protein
MGEEAVDSGKGEPRFQPFLRFYLDLGGALKSLPLWQGVSTLLEILQKNN